MKKEIRGFVYCGKHYGESHRIIGLGSGYYFVQFDSERPWKAPACDVELDNWSEKQIEEERP